MENLSSKNKVTVMVDLDSLLDTRLATLFNKDPLLVKSNLNHTYFTRYKDSFKNCDFETFKQLFDNRDTGALVQASKTKMITYLFLLFKEITIDNAEVPITEEPTLIINTHPYKLEQVTMDAIRDTFIDIFNDNIIIEVINTEYNNFNLEWINNNVGYMILYDYNKWLQSETFVNNFKKISLRKTHLLIPKLIFEDDNLSENEVGNFFDTIQASLRFYLMCTCLPVEFFNIQIE